MSPTTIPGKLILAKDYPADDDARAYVAAVESADGQSLEPAVIAAYDNFIVGCKADGIWNAIKASCILAGARTLSGALVPLVGTAPTNFNFVAADYDRELGLINSGGGAKILSSNRDNADDPRNDNHNSVFTTVVGSENVMYLLASNYSSQGWNSLVYDFRTGTQVQAWSRGGAFPGGNRAWSGNPGFLGSSRSASNQYLLRVDGSFSVMPYNSSLPAPGTIRLNPGLNGRIAFYSIGEALDLAKLDTRVSTLISDLGAAIP